VFTLNIGYNFTNETIALLREWFFNSFRAAWQRQQEAHATGEL